MVTLNRTEVMNILNTQMRAEITLVVRESGRITRVIVLTGAAARFCSDQDLGTVENTAEIDLELTL